MPSVHDESKLEDKLNQAQPPKKHGYEPDGEDVLRDDEYKEELTDDEDKEELTDDEDEEELEEKSKGGSIGYELASGLLEGAAAGFVLGLCTGGIGWLAIPVLAFVRGFHKANTMRNFYETLYDKKTYVPDKQTDNQQSSIIFPTSSINILQGTALGAGVGVFFGFCLAPFTFGLSIPVCAAIGAGFGSIRAAIYERVNKNIKTSILKMDNSKYHPPLLQASESAELGALAGIAIGLVLAPFTLGISLAVGPLVGVIAGYGISKTMSARTRLDDRNMERYGTYGGAAAGATMGGVIGVFLIPVSFGLSVPICALIGAVVGGLLGRQTPKLKEKVKNFASQSPVSEQSGLIQPRESHGEILRALDSNNSQYLKDSSNTDPLKNKAKKPKEKESVPPKSRVSYRIIDEIDKDDEFDKPNLIRPCKRSLGKRT